MNLDLQLLSFWNVIGTHGRPIESAQKVAAPEMVACTVTKTAADEKDDVRLGLTHAQWNKMRTLSVGDIVNWISVERTGSTHDTST